MTHGEQLTEGKRLWGWAAWRTVEFHHHQFSNSNVEVEQTKRPTHLAYMYLFCGGHVVVRPCRNIQKLVVQRQYKAKE